MTDNRKSQTAARAESRNPSTNTPAEAAPPVGPLAPGQCWSAGRKRDVVFRLLRGESLEALSRKLGVEPYRLAEWREKALLAIEGGLDEGRGTGGRVIYDLVSKEPGAVQFLSIFTKEVDYEKGVDRCCFVLFPGHPGPGRGGRQVPFEND